jgi:hypothetical protein
MTPAIRPANASTSMLKARRNRRMKIRSKEGTRHLMSSSLLSKMRLSSLRIKGCSSSKFASYRTGSTRSGKTCTYSNKPSSVSARNAHLAEELARGLATSTVASTRTGWLTLWSSLEPARTSSPPPCSSATCPSHQTPTPVGLEMKSENSSRPRPCSRLRALPRGDASPPQSGPSSPPVRRERPRFIPSLPGKTG